MALCSSLFQLFVTILAVFDLRKVYVGRLRWNNSVKRAFEPIDCKVELICRKESQMTSDSDKTEPDQFKHDLDEAKSKALDAKDDLNGLSDQAIAALRGTVDELTALLKANAAGTVAALKQAGQSASSNVNDLAGNARDLGRDKLDDLSEAVRRNPLTSLALAVGAGMIFGMMRRNHHR